MVPHKQERFSPEKRAAREIRSLGFQDFVLIATRGGYLERNRLGHGFDEEVAEEYWENAYPKIPIKATQPRPQARILYKRAL